MIWNPTSLTRRKEILALVIMVVGAFPLSLASSVLLSESFNYPDGTLVSSLPTAGPLVRGAPFIMRNQAAECDMRGNSMMSCQEFGSRSWIDYHASVLFTILALDPTTPSSLKVGFYFRGFRFGGYGNRLNVDLRGRGAGNTWLLASEVNGGWYILSQGPLPLNHYLQIGRTYVFEVEAVGNQIKAWLDGMLLFDYDEAQFVPSKEPELHPSGSVALGNANCFVSFDSLVVTSLDTTSPTISIELVDPPNGATLSSSQVYLVAKTSSEGSPVEGATIRFYVDGGLVVTTVTDSTGHASFSYSTSIGTHSWYATAEKIGYSAGKSQTWSFTYVTTQALTVQLIAPLNGATITSSPVNLIAQVTSGGNPVQGATVKFYVDVGTTPIGISSTDSSGHATFSYSPSVAAHKWGALAEKLGYKSGKSAAWSFTFAP